MGGQSALLHEVCWVLLAGVGWGGVGQQTSASQAASPPATPPHRLPGCAPHVTCARTIALPFCAPHVTCARTLPPLLLPVAHLRDDARPLRALDARPVAGVKHLLADAKAQLVRAGRVPAKGGAGAGWRSAAAAGWPSATMPNKPSKILTFSYDPHSTSSTGPAAPPCRPQRGAPGPAMHLLLQLRNLGHACGATNVWLAPRPSPAWCHSACVQPARTGNHCRWMCQQGAQADPTHRRPGTRTPP